MKINGNPDGGGSGDAIWGGITGNINSQTDLINKFNDYATQAWVEGQDYASDPDGVLEGITDPQSEGMLYTFELPGEQIIYGVNIFEDTKYMSQNLAYLYNMLDGLYFYNNSNSTLYKFNDDTIYFEKYMYLVNKNFYPLWKDNTGRLYCGMNQEYDISGNGLPTSVNLNPNNAEYINVDNFHNIIFGKKGIYLFDVNAFQKFNESTKEFESFPLTTSYNNGRILNVDLMEYDGHLVVVEGNSQMWEFVEGDDSVTFEPVSTPYFDVDLDSNTRYLYTKYVHKLGNDYYFLCSSPWEYSYSFYKLVDGHWVHDTSIDFTNYSWDQLGGYTDKYLIGYGHNTNSWEELVFININDTKTITTWQQPDRYCVDLTTDGQQINVRKVFSSLTVKNNIIIQDNSYTQFYGHSHIQTDNCDISTIKGITITNLNGSLNLMNGEPIATTDKCIMNRTITPGGPIFKPVIINEWANSSSKEFYFMTHTGRLFASFYGTNYEFDGTQWNSINTWSVQVYPTQVRVTTNATYFVTGSELYIWDDSNSNWVQIESNGDHNPGIVWSCGDTLRYGSTQKLIESEGTYSWIEDSVNVSAYHSILCNSHVYLIEWSQLYEWDESTKTMTSLGEVIDNGQYNIFVLNNEIYMTGYECVYHIDLSLVGVETNLSVETNFYWVNAQTYYAPYGGKLWCGGNELSNNWGYIINIEESVPAVPDTNGTYVLKAVRTNSGVTYSWVLDEVAQAVQITNEILS